MAILRLDTNPSKVLGKRPPFQMRVALTIQWGYKLLSFDFSVTLLCWFDFGGFVNHGCSDNNSWVWLVVWCQEAAASKKQLEAKSTQGILLPETCAFM